MTCSWHVCCPWYTDKVPHGLPDWLHTLTRQTGALKGDVDMSLTFYWSRYVNGLLSCLVWQYVLSTGGQMRGWGRGPNVENGTNCHPIARELWLSHLKNSVCVRGECVCVGGGGVQIITSSPLGGCQWLNLAISNYIYRVSLSVFPQSLPEQYPSRLINKICNCRHCHEI